MKKIKFSGMCLLILMLTIFLSNSTLAYKNNDEIISRINNLVAKHGKTRVLKQVIGNTNTFTININNKLKIAPHALKATDDDFINALSISNDMVRNNISIDELEKRLKIEAARIEEEAKAKKLIISRIDNLIKIYGKKMILDQILEKDSDYFTALDNGRYCSRFDKFTKHRLKEKDEGFYERHINAHSIYMDITDYKIKIDELEKILPISAMAGLSSERLLRKKAEQALKEAKSDAESILEDLKMVKKQIIIAKEKSASDKEVIEKLKAELESKRLKEEKVASDKKRSEVYTKHRTFTTSPSCYDLGYRYGRCVAMSLMGRSCYPGDDIVIPTSCRGKPETERGIENGMKSVR